MHVAVVVVALVATVVLFAGLAERLRLPAPLLLTVVGIIGSFLPFVPPVRLEPEVVLLGILPPLLYAAAIRTSLIDFRVNRRAIALLSVGLVLFTTVGVGLVAWWLLPVPLAAGFALGAVVAPPDAVAATAVARRVGMPRRIVTILEGESLVNDATALVCLRTAIAALAGTVTVLQVGQDFVVAAAGGVLVGVAVAAVLAVVRQHVETPVLDTSLSLLAPFLAYLPAEAIHASGVLAVVVAGLLLGHKSQVLQGAASRLSEQTIWKTVQFVLENLVFLLIGLQVRHILAEAAASDLGWGRTVAVCLAVLAAVVVLRPIWVFPATYLPRWLVPSIRRNDPAPPWQVPAVISWAGMRGVVTLAAVLVLPPQTPQREVIVLAALVVAAATLLLQGSTLAWLVRRLRLPAPDPGEDALLEASALQRAHEAGEKRLDEVVGPDDPPETVQRLRDRIRERTDAAWERLGRRSEAGETPSAAYLRLRLQMLEAEREALVELRDSGEVPYEVLRRTYAALDLEESMLDRLVDPDDVEEDDTLLAPEPRGVCAHLRRTALQPVPGDVVGCTGCLAIGETSWVHLRMCLACGYVGCCDSSPNRHAEAHFLGTRHPVMRSAEPGEAWRWCYVDRRLG